MPINLSPQQQALLAESKHPVLTESLRDYLVNQQFRRDLWVKGPRPLSPQRQVEAMAAQPFVLLVAPQDVTLKVAGALGEADLQRDVYLPVIEQLAAGGGEPKTAMQVAKAAPQLNMPQVLQALLVLTAAGSASPAQSAEVVTAARPASAALNQHLLAKAAHSGEVGWLASPVTGAGVLATRFQQMFIGSIASGRSTPEDWALDAWGQLSAQGEYIVKNGATLSTASENLAELRAHANHFAEHRVSSLKVLGIL